MSAIYSKCTGVSNHQLKIGIGKVAYKILCTKVG